MFFIYFIVFIFSTSLFFSVCLLHYCNCPVAPIGLLLHSMDQISLSLRFEITFTRAVSHRVQRWSPFSASINVLKHTSCLMCISLWGVLYQMDHLSLSLSLFTRIDSYEMKVCLLYRTLERDGAAWSVCRGSLLVQQMLPFCGQARQHSMLLLDCKSTLQPSDASGFITKDYILTLFVHQAASENRFSFIYIKGIPNHKCFLMLLWLLCTPQTVGQYDSGKPVYV